MQNELLIKKLNSSFGAVRKFAVARAGKTLLSGDKFASPVGEVNLNLHSFYSFSPYSPSLAAYSAATRGIKIAGLCDYGSIGGIKEFEKACGYAKQAYLKDDAGYNADEIVKTVYYLLKVAEKEGVSFDYGPRDILRLVDEGLSWYDSASVAEIYGSEEDL